MINTKINLLYMMKICSLKKLKIYIDNMDYNGTILQLQESSLKKSRGNQFIEEHVM